MDVSSAEVTRLQEAMREVHDHSGPLCCYVYHTDFNTFDQADGKLGRAGTDKTRLERTIEEQRAELGSLKGYCLDTMPDNF
jgi:hypothetical protein